MVVGEPNINNIMGGIESTGSVRLHNHKKKLKQRFDIIKKLGQGTYGKVQLGINKETGQEVAIKTIKKSKIETEADLVRIRREIQIMSSVQHPNIIHIYEVFENREKMVLVMEYAAGGELYDYLSKRKVLPEEEARRIFRQISTACYYFHKHKICHRDLKLENILLDENGNAKIADFGLSNVFDERCLLQTFCGSPLYASPEIVKGTPYHGPEVDCWSLGVLLYTLVYGAMPFDGSNFKRLVKQISQGDYFEPKKPSRASPLIKDMLTVNPRNRADIERICTHWWVNEGYDESCLDISEDLANQTPVRLDLLLSLAPPTPQLESDKLVITGEIADEASTLGAETTGPTKSQSVGSLMDMASPARRRIEDLIADEAKSAKRKLETTVSTDQANLTREGVRRKEKIIKDNTVADIRMQPPLEETQDYQVEEAVENARLIKSETRTLSREMDVEKVEDLANQGAACTEIMEDAKRKNAQQNKSTTANQTPSQDTIKCVDKENVSGEKKAVKDEEKPKVESKIPAKRKVIKKKVLTDKNDNAPKAAEMPTKPESKQKVEKKPEVASNEAKTPNEPTKPVERRRSRIFETAEKFQNMILANEQKPSDKPKKVKIPGVSVGGFKKEFERKASLTSGTILLPKGSMTVRPGTSEYQKPETEKPAAIKEVKQIERPVETKAIPAEENNVEERNEERRTQVRNAVDIIFNALSKDGARKSKSRPCIRKPPVPFGVGGRSASGSIGPLMSPPPLDKFRQFQLQPPLSEHQMVHSSTPAQVVEEPHAQVQEESKTSSAEITLKSATLPRRKTTKAEIKLDYPSAKPQAAAPMGFKTEMAHHVQAAPKLPTQRSEASFPVSSPLSPPGHRSASVEPETKAKERIIPISFERDVDQKATATPIKTTAVRSLQNQTSNTSQDSGNLSRQSTQDSDSETLSTGEPIRKSPREYIIPIAVEGGGYVTPRAGSLEPSESASTGSTVKSRFRRKFLDREGSEEDGPFGTLHRHSSIGKESDSEDPKRDMFRMHSLRSSRPRKALMEHNDSFSSGEEDDDDGFEILTAENLFSTLLSRVRDLTKRMNVDGRPSFQNSRLLSGHFDHGSNFWNLHNRTDPLARRSPLGRSFTREQDSESSASAQPFGTPWRRSVSRDLATDIDSVFNNSSMPTQATTLPRGDERENNKDNLNLSDLNLKKLKLSDEDALALSYLTPGLSRRIQQQLLAQLAPAAARKLSRTLSMRSERERAPHDEMRMSRRSADPAACTLPRRYSVEASPSRYSRPNLREDDEEEEKEEAHVKESEARLSKTSLPASSPYRDNDSPYNDRTESIESSLDRRPRVPSLRSESIDAKPSPLLARSDSSASESISSYKTDDHSNSFKRSNASLIAKPLPKATNSTYGPFSSEASRLSKYLDPAPKFESTRMLSPPREPEKREPRSTSPKPQRRSRFLRPSFYESNTKSEPPAKDEHYFIRDKKEREMEAQQILQEIRDKRERKSGRESHVTDERSPTRTNERKKSCLHDFTKLFNDDGAQRKATNADADATEKLLKNVSENIKKLESSVQSFHDYVNVPVETGKGIHDYVNVSGESTIPNYVNVPGEHVVKKERTTTSRIARPKSYPAEGYDSKDASPKPRETKSRISRLKQPEKKKDGEKTTRSKFLHSIEKKLEKLRSFSNSPTSGSDESKSRDERKSSVEHTIQRLREQSMPPRSGGEEACRTESALIKRAVSVEDLTNNDAVPEAKQVQTSRKSVTKILNLFKKYEDKDKGGRSQDNDDDDNDAASQVHAKTEPVGANSVISHDACDTKARPRRLAKPEEEEGGEESESMSKERPKSLMFDRVKHFPTATCSGAKSESNISNEKEVRLRATSKLPVNTFRRSLNMESAEPSRAIKSGEPSSRGDRRLLRLDLNAGGARKSLADDATFLSPTDDSADSWSVCSESHHASTTSPLSPGGHCVTASDADDSVSERIRRKSFYMRFNDSKRPRKAQHRGNYKDLDLYKEHQRKGAGKVEYGSLDRRTVEGGARERRGARAASSTARLDDDLGGPIRYPTYSPRVGRRSTHESEERSLDDGSGAEKNRMNSYHSQPYKSISKPSNGQPLCTGQSS